MNFEEEGNTHCSVAQNCRLLPQALTYVVNSNCGSENVSLRSSFLRCNSVNYNAISVVVLLMTDPSFYKRWVLSNLLRFDCYICCTTSQHVDMSREE